MINPFGNAAGGSEARTISLYQMLSPYRPVRLWSAHRSDPRLVNDFPVERISPIRLAYPRSGTFVFVGAYFLVGRWIRFARPRRIILVYNLGAPDQLASRVNQLSRTCPVEIVYASEDLMAMPDQPGIFEPSPIDITHFAPSSDSPRSGFTIGRLSRPTDYKHHAKDADFYRDLAAEGCRITLMGASADIAMRCRDSENIVILPPCALPANAFLQGLDCFYYRTSDHWTEAWGRVVFEAMACGLPVVCHRKGGYARYIDHGRNGFLFDRQVEARALLLHLRDRPDIRSAIGKAARRTVEEIFSPQWRSRIVDFYLK